MIDYPAILRRHYPNAEYIMAGDTYDGITFLSDERPTQAQLDALWPQVLVEISNELARRKRSDAFQVEADPLYFAWQRGEATEQDWLDKVAEIRERFPYA
jgi:hypothetical protein